MMKFKLLVGIHQGFDYSQKPDKNGRYPSKTFTAGETVQSETDLVAKHGHEKFQLVASKGANKTKGTGNTTAGDPTSENLLHSTPHFPHGQVSTGFQTTGGNVSPDTGVRSGPMDPEDVEEDDEIGGPVERQQVLPNETPSGVSQSGAGGKTQAKSGSTKSQAPTAPKKATKSSSSSVSSSSAQQAKSAATPSGSSVDLSKLERMSTADLQSLAEDEEIDLKGVTQREEIIKIIKEECEEEEA